MFLEYLVTDETTSHPPLSLMPIFANPVRLITMIYKLQIPLTALSHLLQPHAILVF